MRFGGGDRVRDLLPLRGGGERDHRRKRLGDLDLCWKRLLLCSGELDLDLGRRTMHRGDLDLDLDRNRLLRDSCTPQGPPTNKIFN